MGDLFSIHGGRIDSSSLEEAHGADLKPKQGGGSSGGMEPATREYVDLKLAAAMTEVRGEFALLNQRLGDMEKRLPSWWSILGAVMIGVATIIGALALAGDHLNTGMALADKRQEQLERDRQQNDRIEAILKRLDAQSASPSTPASPSGTTSGN